MRSEQLFEIDTSPLVHIINTGLRNNSALQRKELNQSSEKEKSAGHYKAKIQKIFVSIEISYDLIKL